jgi:UvrD-like helicase C-terminal domain
MSNERRARKAKQVRRDERRAKKRSGESSVDTTPRDATRRALAGGHPLSLLTLASMVIHVAKPEPSKGLERRAVVLVVNEESAFERSRERLYVGLSRARDQLVVCGDPDFIREVGGPDLARRLNLEPI